MIILDNISSRLLKQTSKAGIFPDDWKKAEVYPIFKSDERNIPNNHRPIFILPAILKIIEKVIHTQLFEYFLGENLWTDSQYQPNLWTDSQYQPN